MKELKVFNLPFRSDGGFDDTPLQHWLAAGRLLTGQSSHLIDNSSGCWLVLLVETERVSAPKDPWTRPAVHPPAEKTNQHAARADSIHDQQRRADRQKRQKDLEAALARLDERSAGFYQTLRAWRAARAIDTAIPVYEFGSDLLLCEIARVRPTTLEALRAIPYCRPRLLKIAGEELLEVVRAFEAGEELAWRQAQGGVSP
jgi:superfamily II DNA helicase RecQ